MPKFSLAELAKTTEDAPSFEPVPAGTYFAVVEKPELDQTSNGKPFIKADLKIVLSSSNNNRVIFNNMFLTEKAAPWTFRNIENGWGLTKEQIIESGDNAEKLLSKYMTRPVTIEVEVYDDTYEKDGDTKTTKRNNVKSWAKAPDDIIAKYESGKGKTSSIASSTPTVKNSHSKSVPDVPSLGNLWDDED